MRSCREASRSRASRPKQGGQIGDIGVVADEDHEFRVGGRQRAGLRSREGLTQQRGQDRAQQHGSLSLCDVKRALHVLEVHVVKRQQGGFFDLLSSRAPQPLGGMPLSYSNRKISAAVEAIPMAPSIFTLSASGDVHVGSEGRSACMMARA